ncbi:hypothetical protein [Marininema halotolerans]|uniref:Uncharacterized protein n=1 Tax=Marininema halotolerans TaxID=1155944 RepID=A0A1I6UMW4_9BACL|nr:hypothetical protein [Marininema halotolerans]SFT02790.1 hypothetical protein SAMN05444972_11838 [Marininema halotolerans]
MKYSIDVSLHPLVSDELFPVGALLSDVADFENGNWVEEMIKEIDQVLNSEKECGETVSYACCLEIRKDKTKAFFNFGDEEECEIETVELRRLIIQWLKMIEEIKGWVQEAPITTNRNGCKRYLDSRITTREENVLKYFLDIFPIVSFESMDIYQVGALLTNDVTDGVFHVQLIDQVLNHKKGTAVTESEAYSLEIRKAKTFVTNKTNGYQSEIETVELRRLIEQWVKMKERIRESVQWHNAI